MPAANERSTSVLAGAEVGPPAAVVAQSLTALLCIVLVGLGVRSFVQAGRSRAAG